MGFRIKIFRAVSSSCADLPAEWIEAWNPACSVLADPGCILPAQKHLGGGSLMYLRPGQALWFGTIFLISQRHHFLICKELAINYIKVFEKLNWYNTYKSNLLNCKVQVLVIFMSFIIICFYEAFFLFCKSLFLLSVLFLQYSNFWTILPLQFCMLVIWLIRMQDI